MTPNEFYLLLIRIAINFFQAVQFIIFLAVIFSWFPGSMRHPFVQYIKRLTEPMFRLIKRIVPPIGMIDFSPLIAILIIIILINMLESVANQLAQI